MTTIHSNVTAENHAEVLRLTVSARDVARERRDKLKETFDRRTAPKTDFDDDPAIVSGIRRKTSGSRAQREQATFDRDIDAFQAFQDAERDFGVLERRAAKLESSAPVPFTEEQLRAAAKVRTDQGWHHLLKVNRATVGIEAGFPWPHKISRDRVLEVR